MSYCLRREEHVAAQIADFSRNMVNDDNLIPVPHGVRDRPRLVFPAATLDRAFHNGRLLCVGVNHFGRLGSYTVIITSIG